MDPIEITVIVGALAIFLIWGPSKIPQLARSLGMAQKEYKKAQSGGIDGILQSITAEETSSNSSTDEKLLEVAHNLGINTEGKSMDQVASEIVVKKPAAGSSADDKLLEVAHALGINTDGKTKDQIASEIVAKKSL
jgi:sec-independent protein translocase protein TatA